MYNTEGFSSEYPDLSRVTIDAIKFFVEMNTKPNAVSSSSAGQRTARGAGKHMDDEEMSVPLPSMATLSISSQGCQKDLLSIISEAINAKLRVRFGSLTLTPFQRLQRLVADIPNSLESFTLIVSLLLSQRLFYEAQVSRSYDCTHAFYISLTYLSCFRFCLWSLCTVRQKCATQHVCCCLLKQDVR